MRRLIWIVAAILLVACSGGAAAPETAVPTAEPPAPAEEAPAATGSDGATETETTDEPQLQLIEFYADW